MNPEVEALKHLFTAVNRTDMQAITKDFDPQVVRTEFEGFPTPHLSASALRPPDDARSRRNQPLTCKRERMSAIELFKDWTNVLLTTTLAAIGWTTARERISLSPRLMRAATLCLCASVLFGILTLAIIPSVAEKVALSSKSHIYETTGQLYVFAGLSKPWKIKLVNICWPQHALFMTGVILYAWSVARSPIPSSSPDH
jgi:hypothetical protein